MKMLFLPLLFFVLTASSHAKDIYVTQNRTGSGNGSSCSNAHDAVWFNNRANWGGGSAQIGSGTTVHLCGHFNGTPGEQMLLVRGSGAAGRPIVLQFETGTVFSAPYWSAQGAIYMNAVSYITVNGGANGLIENTANGTGRAHHQDSRAIYATQCNNCTIERLTISNLYVRTSSSDLAPAQTAINCVYWLDSNDFTISSTTCHDAGWAFAGFGDKFTLENSVVYNIDHGVAFGPQGSAGDFSIHGNHFYNYVNWDSAQNRYHHDGIHIWGRSGGRITSGVIYNNRFDGDSGNNITAHIYLQDSIQNVAVYNNVFIVPADRTMNALWFAAGTNDLPGGIASGNSAFNNYINAGGHRQGSALFIQGQHNFTAVNNVLIGGLADISLNFSGSLSSTGIDHNIYLDLDAAIGDGNAFGYFGRPLKTLSAWRAACHCDANSKLVSLSQIKANSVGQLLSGSVGISAGRNLMNLATGVLSPLAHDLLQTQRPSGANWDAGAFQTVNGQPRPVPPNGLTANIH